MNMRMGSQFPNALPKRPLESHFPCTAVSREERGQCLQQVAVAARYSNRLVRSTGRPSRSDVAGREEASC